jgi:hypothetical protein
MTFATTLRTLASPLLCVGALGACSGGSATPAPAAGTTLSIAQGVYGWARSYDDVGPTPTNEVLRGFPIDVFASQPPPTPGDGRSPLAHAETDDTGFYELTLPVGHHWLCTSFRRCTEVDIAPGTTVRKDYQGGPGPGW